MIDIKILRKEDWDLNPNDNVVNGILKALIKNDGHCPCVHPERRGHDQCPCSEYLQYDNCLCNLYVKSNESSKN